MLYVCYIPVLCQLQYKHCGKISFGIVKGSYERVRRLFDEQNIPVTYPLSNLTVQTHRIPFSSSRTLRSLFNSNRSGPGVRLF